MITQYYAQFGGIFWTVLAAVLTFFLMMACKKPFLFLLDKIPMTKKGTCAVHLILGVAESVSIAVAIGCVYNYLTPFPAVAHKWFILGGLFANYAYLLYEKYKESDRRALAKSFEKAVEKSKLPVEKKDLSAIADRMDDVVEAFANSDQNTQKVIVDRVAEGVTGTLDITAEKAKEFREAIEQLKREGYNTAGVERELEKVLADGKIEQHEADCVSSAIANTRNGFGA